MIKSRSTFFSFYIAYFFMCNIFVILAIALQDADMNNISEVFYKPFSYMGGELRALSLKSMTGNVLSYTIYIVVCLLPVAVYLIFAIRKKQVASEIILPIVMSLYLAFTLFLFINPHLIVRYFVNPLLLSLQCGSDGAKTGLAFIFYLMLILALVIYAFKLIKRNNNKVYSLFNLFIFVASVLCICDIFLIHLHHLLVNLNRYFAQNTIEKLAVAINIFSYMMRIVPPALLFVALNYSRSLSCGLRNNAYDKANVVKIKRLMTFSQIAIIVSIGCCIADNMAQFIGGKYLFYTSFNLDIPVTFIAMLSVVVIVSKILINSIKDHEENCLTI